MLTIKSLRDYNRLVIYTFFSHVLHSLRARHVKVRFVHVLGRGKRILKDSVLLIARFYSRSRRVKVRFVRVLGRGKRVSKDSVRLIARFYSRSEYDKPLEC